MCEPSHSIVQYPDRTDDDHDLPFNNMDMGQRLRAALGENVARLGKKIKSWFHFSKIGSGHTDAIKLSGKGSLILPEHTRYEGDWWDRTFQIDGPFAGARVDKTLAFNCAEDYHNQTVMLNMKTFRRFLEASLISSSYSERYVERLLESVLTGEGRDKVRQRINSVLKGRGILESYSTVSSYTIYSLFTKPDTKLAAIKVIMGITRQRKLFQTHWRDDDKLWAT